MQVAGQWRYLFHEAQSVSVAFIYITATLELARWSFCSCLPLRIHPREITE